MKKSLLILSIVFLASCAGTTQYAKFPDSEKLESTTDARIYVIRPSSFASSVKMKIYCNDELIGKTGPHSYLGWEVKEGEYTIKSNSTGSKDFYTINAKAGKTYYIRQTLTMGVVVAGAKLESLDKNEGQSLLKKLKKPKSNYSE